MNFIAKHNVKRALVTRNSKKVAQVLLDKLSQQVTKNEHLYPHLDPANIFSEASMKKVGFLLEHYTFFPPSFAFSLQLLQPPLSVHLFIFHHYTSLLMTMMLYTLASKLTMC